MCKTGRIALMAAGLTATIVETGIPRMGYLGMWIVCAGVIHYGAGAGDIKIEDSHTGN